MAGTCIAFVWMGLISVISPKEVASHSPFNCFMTIIQMQACKLNNVSRFRCERLSKALKSMTISYGA